jgi:predicted acyltransferase
MEKQKQSRRLLSLDALRGFDMFFIMGGSGLLASLALWIPCSFTEILAGQMEHVSWNGLAHHDTIFPLFLFIAGISFPFSLDKQRSQGKSRRDIFRKIITRGLILVFLGILYNGLLNFDFSNFRFASVLARIGLGWMFAALLFVTFSTRVRAAIAAAILIGYWLFVMYVPVPGATEGPLSLEGNWVGYIDRILLPGYLHQNNIFDPEGLLSTIPAIVTAMLGMFTGQFVKNSNSGMTDTRKVLWLVAAGIALLIVGLLWAQVFPINKKLWTSSFVCVVGSYSVLMFALFYYIIDVLGWKKWTFFFKIIGLNSITIYLAQKFISFSFTADKVFGGTISLLPESMQSFAQYLAYIAVCWLFLYFLYRKKIFLKV